jgi:hypothetical protein
MTKNDSTDDFFSVMASIEQEKTREKAARGEKLKISSADNATSVVGRFTDHELFGKLFRCLRQISWVVDEAFAQNAESFEPNIAPVDPGHVIVTGPAPVAT